MKSPYEELGVKSRKVLFVPADQINADGSKTPVVMRMSEEAIAKIEALSRQGKGKKRK